MNNMAICNYIVGVISAIIGGLIMNGASEFPREFTVNGPGPGFWPYSLGVAILIAAICLLCYTFYKKADLSVQYVALATVANKRVYLMMGLTVLFCVLVNLLGFYPAAAVLIPCIMRLMDYRDSKYIALTTVLTIAFIYLVFGMLLNTRMPESIFLE